MYVFYSDIQILQIFQRFTKNTENGMRDFKPLLYYDLHYVLRMQP